MDEHGVGPPRPRRRPHIVDLATRRQNQIHLLILQLGMEKHRIRVRHASARWSRKAIANFKLRAGVVIGLKVTLRGARMYQFVDKLVSVALPRIRDFRGVSPTGFDGRGNYTLGLREQLVFPEIDYDKIDKVRGMEVTFVTTARTDDEARVLLTELGFPFRK